MTNVPPPLRSLDTFKRLEAHNGEIGDAHVRDLFAADPERGTKLVAEGPGLYLDYSKNRVTEETLSLLVELADEAELAERRAAMFRGEHINSTEDRAVLHIALRMPHDRSLVVGGTVAGRPLRALGFHAGRGLGHQFLRPMGRRARQGRREADHPRAPGRGRARARQLDDRADPPGRVERMWGLEDTVERRRQLGIT